MPVKCPTCGDRIFKIYEEEGKKVVKCRKKHKIGILAEEVL